MSKSLAIVIGASGGIGAAVAARLEAAHCDAQVMRCSRTGKPAVDLVDEGSIAALASIVQANGLPLRLVFNAAGLLHDSDLMPEKSWRDIDPARVQRAFAVNTIGPMLLMKHLLPLFPRDGRAVFASLSAKVGSIGDNRLGGWYAYRASKTALNQAVKTASIELARRHPEAICVALHPGTVETGLSAPFTRAGLDVISPDEAARDLLKALDGFTAQQSGGFFDRFGRPLPW